MNNLRPLFPYLRKYRLGLAAGLLSVLFTNAIGMLFPLVLGRAVDVLNGGVNRHKVIISSVLLVGIAIAKSVFQFLNRWIIFGVSRSIELNLRNDLFQHLESLSYSFYHRTRTGDIMARATNDLNAVRVLVGPALMHAASSLVFTAGAIFLMLDLSPKLTLWAVFPLLIGSVAAQYFGRRIHDRFERIQAMFSNISACAQENFSGMRILQAYVQEDPQIRAFGVENKQCLADTLKLVRLMGVLWPTLGMMAGLATVVALWFGGREVLLQRMSLGTFVAFNTYMVQLTWPVVSLGWVINIVQSGRASMGRINQILAEAPEVKDDLAVVCYGPETQIRGEIEFSDLSFAYPGNLRTDVASPAQLHSPVQVLKNISLRVPAGSSLAIVGPTGSGKSTLVSLIARIYDAEPGAVLIDGHPIREFQLEHLRRSISFVPQETFLFSDTIGRNITFGAEDASADEVRYAAECGGIDHDIEVFPERYATLVGERGVTLSGGQKQRIAIARAVIRDPRILVLDDALASVDTRTEEHILNQLREEMRGRTTIFISHRVSTVRNADRIAVLHDGKIVEYGTHDELLALNGYYTNFHNKQLLEEELETV